MDVIENPFSTISKFRLGEEKHMTFEGGRDKDIGKEEERKTERKTRELSEGKSEADEQI